LAAGPRLVLLDEPSSGLAPMMVEKVFDAIRRAAETLGTAVLVVEQNLSEAFRIADRAYVMTQGRIAAEGKPADLEAGGRLQADFFGERSTQRAGIADSREEAEG
jgi:branched-chain amino acid transport system ATP-binding protein